MIEGDAYHIWRILFGGTISMPWSLVRRDGKVCVVKEGGEVKKCYDKRRDALAYLRALYSNAGPEAKKEAR